MVLVHPRAVSPRPDGGGGGGDRGRCALLLRIHLRAGSRLVEVVVDLEAEESVAPPNAFAGEIHASPISKAGGRYKAANWHWHSEALASRKFGFATMKAACAVWVSEVAVAEHSFDSGVTVGGSWKPSNIQGTRWRNREHQDWTEDDALARRGGINVLRMWVAARAPGFPGPGT